MQKTGVDDVKRRDMEIAGYKLLRKFTLSTLSFEIHISINPKSQTYDGPGRKIIYLVDGMTVEREDFMTLSM